MPLNGSVYSEALAPRARSLHAFQNSAYACEPFSTGKLLSNMPRAAPNAPVSRRQ
jgi:hypothetical protein